MVSGNIRLNARLYLLSVCLVLPIIVLGQTPKVTDSHPKTRWTDHVSKTLPHPEYPRPQMVRKDWVNLNGQWDFGIGADVPFDSKILVPFPVESRLSGVTKNVGAKDQMWYRRTFNRPKGDRVLLHFGACDYDTAVLVNGKPVGVHTGGYDPFTFDITDQIKPYGSQELIVQVMDPSDASTQPRGKQVHKPGGIFYTSTSGIWQTVWLEGVSKTYIDSLRIDTFPKAGQVNVRFNVKGPYAGVTYSVEALDGAKVVAQAERSDFSTVTIKIPSAKWWSPESPYLYDLKLALKDSHGNIVDTVTSYVGFREVSVQKDTQGITRIFLNGKPCFMVGPLDQGFWPDGLYTAPTDDALKYDIEAMKKLGFNMIRKHVKVEPDRWYYWCDKIGMLVWQDMPSGDGFIAPNDPDLIRSPASTNEYEKELKAMIDFLRNHPSIVTWIPFNEGWGQFETARITALIKSYDPSRLVDSTTGWADRKVGDMLDWHVYPGPASPKPEDSRAAVLGEFGGLGLPIPGHTWQKEGWGYRSYKTAEELTDAGVDLFDRLHFLIGSPGLSAAVYTQTSDVETEVNGLMTYDREIMKMDSKKLGDSIRRLYKPAPILEELVATSQTHAQQWRMTLDKPTGNWESPTFDDAKWSSASGGFGTEQTPGAIVGTLWTTGDIWLRRTFTSKSVSKEKRVYLNLYHDEDVEVYIDGMLVLKSPGYISSYTLVPLPSEATALFTSGTHTLAVHCHQTTGGQFIDLGISVEK